VSTGEVPDPGPSDGATTEGSSEGDDHNGEESDEEGKVHSHSPDGEIVTPGNFDSHMAAATTHSNIPVQRLVQSVKQVGNCTSNVYTVSSMYTARYSAHRAHRA
jgi:hypothetical protein